MSLMFHARVGAIAYVMSNFVHHINPINDTYHNRPKNHKLQGVVLVEEDTKVVRWGADTIPVFLFTHADFIDEQFYTTKRYIYVI